MERMILATNDENIHKEVVKTFVGENTSHEDHVKKKRKFLFRGVDVEVSDKATAMNPDKPQDPMSRLAKYIQEHFSEQDLSIKRISQDLNFSDTYLCMICKKNTGKTINKLITDLRMEKACELLKNTDMKLYKIGEEIGYIDGKYFFRVFQRKFAMTPRQYRES